MGNLRKIHHRLEVSALKVIGILLIIVGVGGLALSTMAFGDIGLSFAYAGIVSILSGIGFLAAKKHS